MMIAPVAMSVGNWLSSNIRFAGLISGLITAAVVLLIGYYLDRLILGRGRVLALFGLLSVPLVVVPSWRPDYLGGFDSMTANTLQGQHLPGLSAILYSNGSSWKWSREIGAHLSIEQYHALPESAGLADSRFASLIYKAVRNDRGNEPWIAITRSGPRIDEHRRVFAQTFPVLVDRGPFAGRALQEIYQYTGNELSLLFVISRGPSWQFQLGSKVSVGFARWLTSIDAFQTLEETYWIAIMLYAFLALWSLRRLIQSVRGAWKLRAPTDQQPFLIGAFVLFVLGDRGAYLVMELRVRYQRRARFDRRGGRRDYYLFAFSALYSALLEEKEALLALWRRRTAQIFSRF